MSISNETMNDLGLFSKEKSVLKFIDNTSTKMGKRLLIHSLLHPYTSKNKIQKRRDNVNFFFEKKLIKNAIINIIAEIIDIENIIEKLINIEFIKKKIEVIQLCAKIHQFLNKTSHLLKIEDINKFFDLDFIHIFIKDTLIELNKIIDVDNIFFAKENFNEYLDLALQIHKENENDIAEMHIKIKNLYNVKSNLIFDQNYGTVLKAKSSDFFNNITMDCISNENFEVKKIFFNEESIFEDESESKIPKESYDLKNDTIDNIQEFKDDSSTIEIQDDNYLDSTKYKDYSINNAFNTINKTYSNLRNINYYDDNQKMTNDLLMQNILKSSNKKKDSTIIFNDESYSVLSVIDRNNKFKKNAIMNKCEKSLNYTNNDLDVLNKDIENTIIEENNFYNLESQKIIIIQKLKGSIIFTTKTILRMNTKFIDSRKQIIDLMHEICFKFLKNFKSSLNYLFQLNSFISEIDLILSFCNFAEKNDCCIPEEGNGIIINESVHVFFKKEAIPSTVFSSPLMFFTVITGLNMSGKTTYLKQIAINIILAQIGCPLIAKYA
ncbi:MutS protein msh4 [Gurleya vavrai]